VVVDYGTFYGEAKSAIASGGMQVLSINPNDPWMAMAQQVLNTLDLAYAKDPLLHTADRELSKMIALTIPGYLISSEQGGKILLPESNVDPRLREFLSEQQIGVFHVKTTQRAG
jgi:hypothetical protein